MFKGFCATNLGKVVIEMIFCKSLTDYRHILELNFGSYVTLRRMVGIFHVTTNIYGVFHGETHNKIVVYVFLTSIRFVDIRSVEFRFQNMRIDNTF